MIRGEDNERCMREVASYPVAVKADMDLSGHIASQMT